MEIRKTRPHAGSIVIALTGFVNSGEHYKIETNEKGQIVLTKVN